MELKSNINAIHVALSSKFDNIIVEEKSDINRLNYIKLSINENNKNLVVFVSKSSLEYDIFNWEYLSNPMNESSDLISRTSNINSFINDVEDIFNKNRFNSEYIEFINK